MRHTGTIMIMNTHMNTSMNMSIITENTITTIITVKGTAA